LKDAEEKVSNLNMKYINENKLRVSLEEETLRLVQETTAALTKEKEKFSLASQELDNLRGQTLDEIAQYKLGICELNQKLELAMKDFKRVDEERRMLHAVTQEKQLSLFKAKEREHQKQMESIVVLVQGFLNSAAGFENRVTENISNLSLRYLSLLTFIYRLLELLVTAVCILIWAWA
jgi:hypothetical protein